MNSLTITNEQLKEMIAHVDSLAPLESCGLLAGKNSSVEKVLAVTNEAQSEVRYAMNPIEQLNSFEWIESSGLELLGIFHSHPAGPETVSPTDIAEAHYQVVYVILSRAENSWRARGFWIENGKFSEVILQIT
jgi:proteasome lid subunit RPN8/RPN11